MKRNLPFKNFFDHIFSLAQKQPGKTALLTADKEGKIEKTISYKELKKFIEYAAFWLMQNGLQDKDVFALAMPVSLDFLILSWSAWGIGIVTVPLDTKRDTIDSHKFKLDTSLTKLIVTKKDIFSEQDKKTLSKYKIIEIQELNLGKIDKKIPWKNDLDYQALTLFTSGTTAHPKGAKLSLKNLIVNAEGIRQWFKISRNDRFMVVLPLYHINSTTFCLATLLSGGSICLVPGYSNSKFWQQLSKTSSTFTSIVPSICFDQLSRTQEFKAVREKLKINRIQIGSAPVVVSDVKEFMNLFDIPLYQGYGQTETALRVSGVPLNLDKKTYDSLIESNSIGRRMDWAEVQIMNDEGIILKENEEGELAVKGDAIMKEYINKEKAFMNGYFLTGDLGFYRNINNERYFFLKGRKKEIIIKGGINISPVAVENNLKESFRDIDQVFVIGVLDRRYGEEIAAVICWKNVDIEKAKAFVKYSLTKGISSLTKYETPKYIAAIDSKDLPMTSTGKVQRSLIKNKIAMDQFEEINSILNTNQYSFVFLAEDSLKIKQAFDLYNYSWHPLTVFLEKFKERVRNETTIAALDKENKVAGLISLMRLDITESQLGSFTYARLRSLEKKSIVDNKGNMLVCVSICGPNYKQEDIPNVSKIPNIKEVENYLLSGKDSVFNFHSKPKGGFAKGASLIKIMSNARPEDKRSLGYNMLLKYPKIVKNVYLTKDASVAVLLIEAVMSVARQFGIENIYAFSRPSGLAQYLNFE